LQIYTTAWAGVVSGPSGLIISDGSNVRFRSGNGIDTAVLAYRKLA
jgi:hypothetical protein